MIRSILFLCLISCGLYAQEQVSDIVYEGVYDETNVERSVGFAMIGGTQYMLEEKDSLVISIFEEDSFRHHGTMASFDCKLKVAIGSNYNRSFFSIVGDKYYRFYKDGFQIIDIDDLVVDYEFDFTQAGYDAYIPSGVTEERLYFYSNSGNTRIYFSLEFESDTIEYLPLPSGFPVLQDGNDFFVAEFDKISYYNAVEGVDSIIYSTGLGIHHFSFSEQDTTFVVFHDDGTIAKIDKDFSTLTIDCTLFDSDEVKDLKVNGDKLISVYNVSSGGIIRDSIFVTDIKTCTEDFSFLSGEIKSSSNDFRFVKGSDNSRDYSIVGYRGQDFADGLNEGEYYLIDHERNQVVTIPTISEVRPYTSFKKDDMVYFCGQNDSFWGATQYIIKVDLLWSEAKKLGPPDAESWPSLSIGYHEGDELICAFNHFQEDPAVWKISKNEDFERVQDLNFDYNLGVEYISDIVPMEDRLYFSNNSGLHSILHEDRSDYLFEVPPYHFPSFWNWSAIAVHEEKIGLGYFGEDLPQFITINTVTGEKDTLVGPELDYPKTKAVGPLIFFNRGVSSDELMYFDLKSGTIETLPQLTSLSSRLVIGTDKSFYFRDFTLGNDKCFFIDHYTNEFVELDLTVSSSASVFKGHDDSFYVVDRGENGVDISISIVRSDKSVEVIYEGEGEFSYDSFNTDEKSKVKMFLLNTDDGRMIVVANDLVSTDVREIETSSVLTSNARIICDRRNSVMISARTLDGTKYWIYNAFGPPVEVHTKMDEYEDFVFMTRDYAGILFIEEDGSSFLLRHQLNSGETTYMEDITGEYNNIRFGNGAQLNESEFLLSASSHQMGWEPWVLDFEEGTVEPIVDFYPGKVSSHPSNFVHYKEWIYFVLRMKGGARQWFRMATDLSTHTIEEVVGANTDLHIYPSPALNIIHIDEYLKTYKLYDVNGILIGEGSNYSSGQPIDIQHLSVGNYILIGEDKDARSVVGRFGKVR